MRAPRILTAFLWPVPLLVAGCAARPLPADRAAAIVPRDTTVACAGLTAPVRIVTDRSGIPHLRAGNLRDLYFAWGYVTARDRLWQMEYTRRSARGQLWRWFGNRTLVADGGAQLFELAEHARRAWARDSAAPAVAVPLERYAAGVNAYVARCRRGEAPWPEEFLRLRRTPEDWRPEDSVLILYAMAVLLDLSDLPELDEGRAIREHGRDSLLLRRRFEADRMFDTVPDSAAARLYGTARSAGAPPGPAAARPTPASPGVPPALLAAARRTLDGWLGSRPLEDRRASNVFAVGRARSASGAPLLANDIHLSLADPNPFALVHVSVPGVVEAAGAAVPGIPAIVSGRNEQCAWGITALSADAVDVYADSLAADGRRVRWNGGWTAMREAAFDLRFRKFGIPLPPIGQVRRYTPHGPVVALDRKRGVALSVRWAGIADSLTFAGLVGLERSRSVDELCARCRRVWTPGLNVVAADRAGHLRYQTVGALPRRGFDPGPGPLPGDGRHEWLGFVPADSMPAWDPPPAGFVVNGNNRPVGPPYPEPLPRFDWPHWRARRMAQRLAGDRAVTLADMRSVQNDVFSNVAARFAPLLIACADSVPTLLTPRMRAALDSLRAWDGLARRDRVGPTIHRGWYGAFFRRSRLEGVPGLAAAALEGRAPEALREPVSGRSERPATAAVRALELAMAELEKRLGPELATWTWGRAHRARFAQANDPRLRDLEPPPEPADGDNSSVCTGSSALPWSSTFRHAPVLRHLVDLTIADSSLTVLPPGNSGDTRSPHARDHIRRWANHAYVPLYLSWERIDAAKESELTLAPAR